MLVICSRDHANMKDNTIGNTSRQPAFLWSMINQEPIQAVEDRFDIEQREL